ncbi:MAG TPA: hypothetical protein PK225_08295 [Azonexus sp.]|nr:hypothetical protein [Azonexus sp.]
MRPARGGAWQVAAASRSVRLTGGKNRLWGRQGARWPATTRIGVVSSASA